MYRNKSLPRAGWWLGLLVWLGVSGFAVLALTATTQTVDAQARPRAGAEAVVAATPGPSWPIGPPLIYPPPATPTPTPVTVKAVPFDFSGDRRADLSVFSPSSGSWALHNSATTGTRFENLGAGDVRLVPGDYDYDRIYDVAIFRAGTWTIKRSSTGQIVNITHGFSNSIPVPADYDGDGKTDLAVFTNGTWSIKQSRTNTTLNIQLGSVISKPVAADFNGDRRDDLAVFANGIWNIIYSGTTTINTRTFGVANDIPVPADYDGDRRADLAVCRAGGSLTWYISQSSNGQTRAVSLGLATLQDKPVPADYDGDGKADLAAFRNPGRWEILQSATNTTRIAGYGLTNDLPVPGAFVR